VFKTCISVVALMMQNLLLAPMSSTIELEKFLSPNPSTKFSRQYFGSLTFEKATALEFSYPTILAKGSVQSWAFCDEIYTTSSATTIQPCELIPHYEDICGIVNEMTEAYAASAHSVRLALSLPDREDVWVVHYHFLKARHFSVISCCNCSNCSVIM
jgi:hypothetical protein